MGAMGAGVFENDDALDFLGDLEQRSPSERAHAILGALDRVVLSTDYIDAPLMCEALAGAGAVGASLNPGAAQDEPYRPEWLVSGGVAVDEELIEKSRQVLRRAVRSRDNEWWELWDEAELADEAVAACRRALAWLGDRDD